MGRSEYTGLVVSCVCGASVLAVGGAPIVTVTCYCTSCRAAGKQLARLPGATPLLGGDGGTDMVLVRKDKVHCLKGAAFLRESRLVPESKCRRVVAACCNSAMYLEFTQGHWLSLYRDRLPAEQRPPVEMRVMTRDASEELAARTDLPNYTGHSGRFMWKLMTSWAAMGFRSPKLDFKIGALDAEIT